ncbi:MAG TPA: DUF6448 family protein [Actinomycetota bacterium]|jgi:hypothetical protein|nr:DUF6448 family protein [Actinomycetota bacterium]
MPPHCDALDGPVVKAATRALDAQDVDLVLPYVKTEGEDEVRAAFTRAVKARQAPDAREVADLYFFETVVRVHRRGEGAPYTGLKPAGLDVGPVIPAAERAIESGSPDELSTLLIDELRHEVKHRFDEVMVLQRHAGGPVPEARAYVEAMLGLQVWSHGLYLGMQASPHGEGEHER